MRVNDFRAVVALTRLGDRDREGFISNGFAAWEFSDARLRDRLTDKAGGPVAAVFEPEEAVCAVRDAGSLRGRVGERGFGFTKPVCGGEGGILVFDAAL